MKIFLCPLHTGLKILKQRGGLLAMAMAVLSLTFVQFCSGQSFTSSITGLITDPTGASVQGAAIELKNMATNDVHQVKSDSNGSYQFDNLAPGTYQITTTAQGFKTFLQQNLILQANIGARVNVSLEVGGTEQKIEVTGAATLVDTETANTSVTLDSQLLAALPNSTRNPLNFVFAIAGTTEAPGGQTQKSGTLDQLSSNFGINGGRTGDESILIDGSPSQAIDWEASSFLRYRTPCKSSRFCRTPTMLCIKEAGPVSLP